MKTSKTHYHLWIPPNIFKRFKVKCAMAGNAMSTTFIFFMREYVDGKIQIPQDLGVHSAGKRKA